MAKTYRIHPAIGFARVGNSPETFLGPERVGEHAVPADGKYRDAAGQLRRQAARFWVYEHDDAAGTAVPVAPAAGGVAKIVWTVHLKNKKAVWFAFAGTTGEAPAGYPPGHPLRNAAVTADRQKKLVIDPGRRTLEAGGSAATTELSKGTSSTPAAETWPPPLNGGAKVIDHLGTLAVDPEGRLTVAGGFGVSGTTGALPAGGGLDFVNNDGWFDDTSDGPVTATVVFANGTTAEAVPAWVAVGPPDYAPGVENLVTVYDLLYDLGLRKLNTDPAVFAGGAFQPSFQPSFTKHIYPVLRRALEYQWVIKQAAPHEAGGLFDIAALAAPAAPPANPRADIFDRMRDPDNLMAGGVKNMPKLHNDGVGGAPPESFRFTVTRFQFFALKQWSAGLFLSDWPGSPPPPAAAVTAAGLDRAAMEAATGGSFFPGMEVSWILRDPAVFVTPFEFRFRHLAAEGPTGLTAGDATKRMALPWQADFHDCANNWWPAQRPNQVFVGAARQEWMRGVSSHVHMTDAWAELGVVAPDPADPARLIETERTL